MRNRNRVWLLLRSLVLAGALASPQGVQGQGVVREASGRVVTSDMDVLLAGHTAVPAGFADDPGRFPASIPVTAGDTLVFPGVGGGVTPALGSVDHHGPEGGRSLDYFVNGTNVFSAGGISGIIHRYRTLFLAGVFVGPTEPEDPPPPRLDVSDRDGDAVVAPLLHQTFYVGDGLTGRGAGDFQEFVVPAGATRLFLGFADAYDFQGAPGAYGDNNGEVGLAVQPFTGAVPDLTLTTIDKLKVKLKFKAAGKDSIMLKTVLPLPGGFVPEGKTLDLDVGGVGTQFAIAKKGKAKNAAGRKVFSGTTEADKGGHSRPGAGVCVRRRR